MPRRRVRGLMVILSAQGLLSIAGSEVLNRHDLPLVFEANEGQAPSDIQFLARARNYTVGLTARESIFLLSQSSFRMRLIGARPTARLAAVDELPGYTSYFRG